MATGVTCESLNSDFDFFTNFQHVISFLEKQKELMDAHMVDFFISAHWETLLREKLEKTWNYFHLNSSDLCQRLAITNPAKLPTVLAKI